MPPKEGGGGPKASFRRRPANHQGKEKSPLFSRGEKTGKRIKRRGGEKIVLIPQGKGRPEGEDHLPGGPQLTMQKGAYLKRSGRNRFPLFGRVGGGGRARCGLEGESHPKGVLVLRSGESSKVRRLRGSRKKKSKERQ